MWVWRWWPPFPNVSLALVRAGYAVVYEGMGAVYGVPRYVMDACEERARSVTVPPPLRPLLPGPG